MMNLVCDIYYLNEDEYSRNPDITMHVRANVPLEEAVAFAYAEFIYSAYMALSFTSYEAASKAAMKFYMAGMLEPPPVDEEKDGTFTVTVTNELGK